jgi:spermidine synthase
MSTNHTQIDSAAGGTDSASGDAAMNCWIREVHQGHVSLGFKVRRTLFNGRSPFQQVDIVETTGHGRMLLNDGIVMLSERDEFVYHEMIAHVPLFCHPQPRRVLIIGGGDGGTAREVLKHRDVTHAVMVEIDKMVIDACRRFMPSVASAYDDPRLELVIDDGVAYLDSVDAVFDVIIVDSTDPVGPARPLFDNRFYQLVARRLAPDGILITQAESPYYDTEIQNVMLENQRSEFQRLHLYLMTNLTYPGGLWGFGFASKRYCPLRDFDPSRPAEAGIDFQYYNADVHRAAFMLPTFITRRLEGVIDPLPDVFGNPVIRD